MAVEYDIQFNNLRQRPETIDSMNVTLRNSGIETWRSAGDSQVVLSYHWYDTVNRFIVGGTRIDTPLPKDLPANDTVTLNAEFRTPTKAGVYLLDWDLRRKDKGWFSTRYQIAPAVVETYIDENAAPWKGNGDVSRWYIRGPRDVPTIDATVPRMQLWKAAIDLAKESPLLGWGPDNFRLRYGNKLGAELWDTKVRSNSLYLELLVGSGLIGLAAFIAMLVRFRWTASAASMGVAVFLLHGFVDVLLMTTPIYFGFWLLLGLAHENRI